MARSGSKLTPRRRKILKLVVQEFIYTAAPVASEALVRGHGISVSSATVRNEMAALEELGMLTHPHTSAGRVPTDQGYRFFVEQLMEWQPLPSEEQRMIQHQFHQVRSDTEEWAHLAAAALARLAQSAAMVTPARARRARFKHLELLSVCDTRVLLVLILQDGTIRQHMLSLTEVRLQEELSRIANRLNNRLTGQSADDIAHVPPAEWQPLERQAIDFVIWALRQLDSWELEEIVQDGILETLKQPEFSEGERARGLVELLERRSLLTGLLSQALEQKGVHVLIGGESQREEMRDYSLIASRYGLAGQMEGVLGILGPTRMPYPRSISAVHFIARTLSEMLGELHGWEDRG